MTPLITIGIPIYNVENYIEEALLSALNQSYPNIEILLVDDKGNDCSMQLTEKITQNHPRKKHITIIRHQKNEGLSYARNTIIENAKGEFLYFMDSDDYITSDCIQSLYNAMESNPVDFVEGSYDIINENNSQKLSSHQHTDSIISDKNCIYNYIYKHQLPEEQKTNGTVWNKLYKIQFLKENHFKFIKGIYYEDGYFVLLLNLKGNSCQYLSKITYHYRERKDSIMHKGFERYSHKEINDFTRYINWRKEIALKYKNVSFFEQIIYKTMTISIFTAAAYLRKQKYIDVKDINPHIKNLIRYPFSFSDIIYFHRLRLFHIKYWGFSKIPYILQLYILKHIN